MKWMNSRKIGFFLGISLWIFCGQIRGEGIPPLLNHKDLQTIVADLQELIPQLMKQARIPGLQIALIRDGRIAWHQNYGQRNATTAEPVTDDTIFEAASLTKPFFAYYVWKLAEQGIVNLDQPLISNLPRELVEEELGHSLDEKGFRRDWFEKITARQVLSHSSGMPHGERGKPFPLFFEPGTKWKYSAEGYYFLQKVVEKLKGDKLENLMQKDILTPLGMTKSSLVWRDDYEKTMANGHGFFGKPEEFRKRREAHAAATLYTTAEDYARFIGAVLNGQELKPETLKEMLTSRIDMDKEKGLGWSLGFGTQNDANGQAIWQWGDYGIFRNYIIAYPKENIGVVYLTNSFYGLGIAPEIIGHSVGGQGMGSVALKYLPYDSPVYRFAWELKEIGPQAVDRLAGLMAKDPDVFNHDMIGFLVETFQEENLTPQVMALLAFNLKQHPQSGSALLELAKAYLVSKDKNQARIYLEKAQEAKEDKVEASLIKWNLEYIQGVDKPVKLEENDLKKLAGDYGVRHLQLRDGRLYYFRESGSYPDYRPLLAMSKDTFIMEGVPSLKLKIELDEKGNPVKLIGLYDDGTRDEMARDK